MALPLTARKADISFALGSGQIMCSLQRVTTPLTGPGEGTITVATALGEPSCTRIHRVEVHRMEITRRELLKGAAALGVAGALPQALPGAAQAQTTQKRELVTAQGGDISKLDPHYSTSSNDIRVSFNLFDNLTGRHPDGKLHPGLATEWKLEGQTTWRVQPRPGGKEHNGGPFTSAEPKVLIQRAHDPPVKTQGAAALATIDRIEGPGPPT